MIKAGIQCAHSLTMDEDDIWSRYSKYKTGIGERRQASSEPCRLPCRSTGSFGHLSIGPSSKPHSSISSKSPSRTGCICSASIRRHRAWRSFNFKVPTLINVKLTYPYFHDGAAQTLAQAVETMGQIQLGKKFTPKENAKIVAFLKTLTGD